jgi:membrane protease YdiL (CAAX protease family)
MEFQPSLPPQPFGQSDWTFTHLLWMVALLLAVLGGGLAVLGVIVALLNPDALVDGVPALSLEFVLGAVAVQGVAFLLPVAAVGWWVGIDWPNALYWRNTSAKWWGIAILLGIVCIPVTGLVATLAQQLMGYQEIYNPQLDFIIPEGFSWVGLIGMTLAVGLLVPLAEEVIFRGVLLSWLGNRASAGVALWVTSILFAAIHGEPSIIAGTFLLGLACGWVVQQSGSLWPAIAIHAMNNGVKVVVLYLALYFGVPLV